MTASQPARKRTWFPHFHLHTDHSIKDGVAPVERYADLVKEAGGDLLAVTDHGQAAVWARQYFACRERGIWPAFGMEAYHNDHRLEDLPGQIENLKGDKTKQAETEDLKVYRDTVYRPSRHCVLLARNEAGYRNLVRMSTDSWQHGYYYFPRTDTNFLERHAEGLIYLTACIGGHIPWLAVRAYDRAVEEARRLQRAFGRENFYVELMVTGYQAQNPVNAAMLRLAREVGAPTVVTCDIHYARPEDNRAQSVLLLMRDHRTIKDVEAGEGGWQFEAKSLYYRTLEEVVACWRESHATDLPRDAFQQAIKNTYALANRIERWEWDLSPKWPNVFPAPREGLRTLVAAGFRRREAEGMLGRSGKRRPDYFARIKRELEVVAQKGFDEYFLILEDVMRAAREMGALTGPARGSAGGCLLAYLLGITDVDPLRFDLLFERFLDIGRPDPPDIDLDFGPADRDRVKDYVRRRFPTTATIGSILTFKARAALKDVARVFGLDHKDMLALTKSMGDDADDLDWDEMRESYPAVQRFSTDNPDAWQVVTTLRDLAAGRGKNAAGVLIAGPEALDYLPLMRDGDEFVTAFPDSGEDKLHKGREITRMGYLKFDCLGVNGLEIEARAAREVARETGRPVLDRNAIPLDDGPTLKTIASGNVPGVFQLDTSTTRPILELVRPETFFEVAIVTALARPGPLNAGLPARFAKAKQAGEDWKRDVPAVLHDILAREKGMLVFQESVMFALQRLAGFSMERANAVRKIIGKKLSPDKLKPHEKDFIDGGTALGHDPKMLAEMFASLVYYSQYAFNVAHSVSYMLTSFWQAWYLTHYPAAYFAALLETAERGKKETGGEGERFTRYVRAALQRGVGVRAPDVWESGIEMTQQAGAIRFGLGKIKGLGQAGPAILAGRQQATSRTLEGLVGAVERRVVNARVFTALVLAGALDSTPFDPAGLEIPAGLSAIGRRNLLLARYACLTGGKKPKMPEWRPDEALEQAERDVLGLRLSWWGSGQPAAIRVRENLWTIQEVLDAKELAGWVGVLAEVERAHVHTTANNRKMAFLTLADESGVLENLTIWADDWKTVGPVLKPGALVRLNLVRRVARDTKYGPWTFVLAGRDAFRVEPVQTGVRA